jgi:protein-L-isoaspartate(D-aspartate) O-methyltransferase
LGSILLGGVAASAQIDPFEAQRHDMVDLQVRQRGVQEPEVLDAMETVPRHLFVPPALEGEAYDDRPLPIAPGQTLSQAYVSARMIALLQLDGDERVLEIGTGSGYDAALLSRLAKDVYTIEIEPALGESARSKLKSLGYNNVHVRIGDGYRGWPDKAPFDAILVTTAPERIPEPLFDQLAPGGRMVIAVGYSLHQDLQVVTKGQDGDREVRRVSLISLAPMTGEVTEGQVGGRKENRH